MAENSAITWTKHTFNPWWGCTKVSPGCTNCYADAFDHRLGGDHWGAKAERKFFGPAHWREPLKWNAKAEAAGVRAEVFCASMSDVGEDRDDLIAERARLIALVDATPWLNWLFLTKRPENLPRLMPWTAGRPNVWCGTTIENADHVWRADRLREVNAAVRFISYEPALGPISDAVDLRDIAWVVAGDESGQKRRPAQVQWFADMRDKCAREGVAFHLKQWAGAPDPRIGGSRTGGKIHLPILDGVQHAAFPESK